MNDNVTIKSFDNIEDFMEAIKRDQLIEQSNHQKHR